MAYKNDTCNFEANKECIAKDAPKRNNYFSGKLMTHKHLITEQQYLINKLKQMNREFTGYGVVNGLEAQYDNEIISVSPGIGIDSCGNVLSLNEPIKSANTGLKNGDYIYLQLKEKGEGRVARYNEEECESNCCDDYIVENVKVFTGNDLLDITINDICSNKDYLRDIIDMLIYCEHSEGKILEMFENNEVESIKEILKECDVSDRDIEEVFRLLEKSFQPKSIYPKHENGSFLLLGRYINGRIFNSVRTELHSNAELSKLLCKAKNTFTKIDSINWEHGKEYMIKLLDEKQVSDGNKNSITLYDDNILPNSKKIKNTYILITEGMGLLQYKKITNFDINTKVAHISPNWKDDQVPNKASKYILIYNDLKEFEEISQRLQFTFSTAMNKTSIDNKTLNVTTKPYVVANKQLTYLESMQLSLLNFDVPICFSKFEPKDNQKQVSFSLLRCYPSATANDSALRDIKAIKKEVKKEAIHSIVEMQYHKKSFPEGNNSIHFMVAEPETSKENFTLKVLRALSKASDFIGTRVHIKLKGDFVLDVDGNPVDANHLRGECPTGNDSAGGTFESWMDVKFDTALLKIFMNMLDGLKKQFATKPQDTNEVAKNTNLSKEDAQLILGAMEDKHVIYRDIKTEKYHPLPDPTKTMIVYDTTGNHFKKEAEKLKEKLKEKGISAILKSSAELIDEDKVNYELILLRGSTLDRNATNMFTDAPSEIEWGISEGDIELINKVDETSSPLFVIGGKNKDVVAKAVENYMSRYNIVK